MSGAHECGRMTGGQEENRREEGRQGRKKRIMRPQIKLRSAQREESEKRRGFGWETYPESPPSRGCAREAEKGTT